MAETIKDTKNRFDFFKSSSLKTVKQLITKLTRKVIITVIDKYSIASPEKTKGLFGAAKIDNIRKKIEAIISSIPLE